MSENYFYSSLTADEIETRLVGGVLYNETQVLSTEEKMTARKNIGAGAENTGFVILGYFPTLEDLQEWLQVIPQAGDAYGIGSNGQYDTYVWDEVHMAWNNIGPYNIGVFVNDADVSPLKGWSSSKIDATKQDKIVASGILKGDGQSNISSAVKGVDYGALTFTITLVGAAWVNETQTILNSNFLSSGFGYIVTPASASFEDYAVSAIYAEEITTDGQMTFHCSYAPSTDLTVNIMRVISA